MLQNWFILLPEICMLSFFALITPKAFMHKEITAKSFFSYVQLFLLATLASTIIFYNKSAFPSFWQNSSFTTLFKFFVYLLAWAWFYLSSIWFLNKNRPSGYFYSICFALLLGFDILASSTSLITLAVVVPYICFFYYKLVLRHWDINQVADIAKKYAVCAVLFSCLLIGGIAIIYTQTKSFSYFAVKEFFSQASDISNISYLGVLLIVSSLLFLMAVAPFHHWFIGFIGSGVLPVCGFITIIPPLIYLCTLINLIDKCFTPFTGYIETILAIYGGISLIIGALSANREVNIRRLFAYLNIYCSGIMLIGLMNFSNNSVVASFAYTAISVLSFSGIYTIFLGVKSRGDYLSDTNSISGFYTMRPFMSAALLIFMFSLIGLAPTLGFFGYLSVINNLVEGGYWLKMSVILFGLLFVSSACLQIVRIIYFETPNTKFDRSDKAIYICLFVNTLLIFISLINPAWLLYDALVIFGSIS
ncbi:MAG: hypothetical protein IKA30_01230 [Alphaproteobacteria bacterium]|nr:hypothetical protein [Alphaproteobacteria bacterium]